MFWSKFKCNIIWNAKTWKSQIYFSGIFDFIRHFSITNCSLVTMRSKYNLQQNVTCTKGRDPIGSFCNNNDPVYSQNRPSRKRSDCCHCGRHTHSHTHTHTHNVTVSYELREEENKSVSFPVPTLHYAIHKVQYLWGRSAQFTWIMAVFSSGHTV